MGLFALVFLDNLSTDSLSDMHFFRKMILFIFGCVGSSCVGFSLVWVSVGHNQWCAGVSLQRLLLLWGTGSGLQELQYVSSALWLPGSSAQAPQSWHAGSTACGIVPSQGSHLRLQHWQAESLPQNHQGIF